MGSGWGGRTPGESGQIGQHHREIGILYKCAGLVHESPNPMAGWFDQHSCVASLLSLAAPPHTDLPHTHALLPFLPSALLHSQASASRLPACF